MTAHEVIRGLIKSAERHCIACNLEAQDSGNDKPCDVAHAICDTFLAMCDGNAWLAEHEEDE